MKNVLQQGKMPVACVCSSNAGVDELIDSAKAASKGESFILLLEYDKGTVKRLLPAYLNAVVRFKDGIARAASIQMEMIVFACGDTDIRKALDKIGIRSADRFLLFATDEAVLKKFTDSVKQKTLERLVLTFDLDAAGEVSAADL